MFDYNSLQNIPEFHSMKYQYSFNFVKQGWNVYDGEICIATIDKDNNNRLLECNTITDTDLSILADFALFMRRPEYKLLHIEMPSDIKDLQDVYEELFVGAVFTRARYHNLGCNPDDAWVQIDRALKWLRTTDFYRAPASSIYHDSVPGGLCFHSIRVAQQAVNLMYSEKFNDSSKLGDAVLCALVHDWCKINLYESYMKNVKNENTGIWEKVQAYRYTGNAIINLGHGVSSMFLISKFFRLNLEEASAIRWHMGAYRTSDAEFNELQTCNEIYPLVHLLQFADQLSLVKY